MSSHERSFNLYVKKGLFDLSETSIKMTRVENEISKGFPDFVFSLYNHRHKRKRHGYIEMKYLKEWPKMNSTIVKLPHFTNEQKNFLYESGVFGGGGCFLFLKIGLGHNSEFLLFDYNNVRLLGDLTKVSMINISCLHIVGNLDFRHLVDCLTFN